MDHNHDDHGTGGDSDDVVCSMNMAFHWGACEFILFRSWQANTVAKFVGATIGFFLLAFIYEGLKHYREVMYLRYQQTQKVITKTDGTRQIVPLSIKDQMLNSHHLLQTILHFLQVFVSYILMLIVMLCNLYLIFAICIGAALGYFTFGWLRKSAVNSPTECCY